MSAVLGISGNYHDAAAALIVDGQLVAACHEERYSRIKHDSALPLQAARACLRIGDLSPGDLDAVVFYENPYSKLERVLVNMLQVYPFSWRIFPRAVRSQIGDKLWVLDQLAEGLGVRRELVRHQDHHRSHAASAFYLSPYDSAAVLTVDAVGQRASTAIWHGQGDKLTLVDSIDYPHAIGMLYAAITSFLGFEVNSGEYKVMGLASYGQPRFTDEFSKLITLRADGSFALSLPFFDTFSAAQVGFSGRLISLLGPARLPGLPWDMNTDRDQRYADIAASLQDTTERAMLGLAKAALARTGEKNLCLAGGVALNAVSNARLAAESGAERIFVQPAAGDAGGALGAAALGSIELGDKRLAPMTTTALGESVSADDAQQLAEHLEIPCRRVQDPARHAAERIARGNVIGWVTGRQEWGPRALGQRSILAKADSTDIRDRINARIKHREPFRPFAPALRAEDAERWFDLPANDMTPFMTTVAPVAGDNAPELEGTTHVDGTARLQTVTDRSAPALKLVLDNLDDLGAPPVVLNTSLNGPGEPIVSSALDAIGFWMNGSLDAMFIDDLLLERGSDSDEEGSR